MLSNKLKGKVDWIWVVSLLAVLMFLAPYLQAKDIACPVSIDVTQTIKQSPPDWQSSNSGLPIRLEAVTFYDGPPAEMAALKFDEQKVDGQTLVNTWHFDMQNGRVYWIACNYTQTSIVLSKPLPNDIKICKVDYDKNQAVSGSPLIMKILCD